MPKAPRMCPGGEGTCTNLITVQTYCADHRKSWHGRTTGQGSTRAWRAVRLQVLQRDDYQCQLRYNVCIGHASEVDHIDDIATNAGDRAITPPIDRLRAACHPCHQERTQQQARNSRNQWKRKPEDHPGLAYPQVTALGRGETPPHPPERTPERTGDVEPPVTQKI
jgi:5-methylcytosine-specific restriction endonuclease McrA